MEGVSKALRSKALCYDMIDINKYFLSNSGGMLSGVINRMSDDVDERQSMSF